MRELQPFLICTILFEKYWNKFKTNHDWIGVRFVERATVVGLSGELSEILIFNFKSKKEVANFLKLWSLKFKICGRNLLSSTHFLNVTEILG